MHDRESLGGTRERDVESAITLRLLGDDRRRLHHHDRVDLEALHQPHLDDVCAALDAADIAYGRATRHGLEHRVTVVEVGLVKGLEVDAVVVVEPSAIVAEEAQGDRALYVALTRATKRLAIVHETDLPPSLRDEYDPAGR